MSNQRSKTKGQLVDIKDKDSFANKIPYLSFGLIGTLAGVSIYFLMPLAVLSFDLGLLLEILFVILIGMIAGLALIALNL